ncbi:hypothetical protein JQM68_12190 [Oscillibacter valericigenes]|uniref:cellulose synthase operon protein YhjQ/BcsQ n=1 Tax=Oscillibacter valericigenes TaxID=351091 RepID=UPI001F389268|nr:cellulose synthase operon protein YhjQ/BcsQ [Oscillibacter valericigenes]MCF2617945.1 hypothetical protein [Oscillibacter valericigenes]
MSLSSFYTEKGLDLAAKILAGAQLNITKVTAGSGTTASDAASLENTQQTLTAGPASADGNTATLPVTLAEALAADSYSLTELGVFAADPDVGEILYQVFRLDEPRTITAGGTDACRFYLRYTVGSGGITVTCSPAGLLVDEDLNPLRAELADTVKSHSYYTGDMNVLTGSGIYRVQKNDNLPEELHYGTVLVCHGKNCDTYFQLGAGGYTGSDKSYLLYRKGQEISGAPSWGPWRKLADTAAPALYDLPLASGIALQENTTAKYWKNQLGEVFFWLRGKTTSEFSDSWVLLATLPEGFRPVQSVHTTVNLYLVSGTSTVATANIDPDGGIRVEYSPLAANSHLLLNGFFAASA